MAGVLRVLNLANPTSVTPFPFGRFELFRIGDLEIGRAVYEPGWRWTDRLRPAAATESARLSMSDSCFVGARQ